MKRLIAIRAIIRKLKARKANKTKIMVYDPSLSVKVGSGGKSVLQFTLLMYGFMYGLYTYMFTVKWKVMEL